MARHDRFDSPSPWIGPGLVLAVLVAVLSAYLLVAWLDCSSSPGTAMCLTALAVALPPAPTWWLRLCLRLSRRAVLRCKAAQLRQAGQRIQREAVVIEIERRLRNRGIKP